MKTFTLIKAAFLLIVLNLSVCLMAQTWSEPNIVYSDNYSNVKSEFEIDKNGNLHCVWLHTSLVEPEQVNFNFIYYSKSMDNGVTWTEPYNVSGFNIGCAYFAPQIAIDTNNVIYVSYFDGAGTPKVFLKKCEQNIWSEADTVTTSGQHCLLVIDHNNKLYCFWQSPGVQKIHYRTLDEKGWSSEMILFEQHTEQLRLTRVKCDIHNNLHCVGIINQVNLYFIYFSYQSEQNGWDDNYDTLTSIIEFDRYTERGLALDTLQSPFVALEEGLYGNNHSVYMALFENHQWDVSLFSNISSGSYKNDLFIDRNNTKYFVHQELQGGMGGLRQQVLYRQMNDCAWEREVLQQNVGNSYFDPQFMEYNDVLYLMYVYYNNIELLKCNIEYCTPPVIQDVVVENNQNIVISWDPPSDTTGLIGYAIYYLDSLEPITTVENDITSYIDSLQLPGIHCYQIEAVYQDGCRAQSSDTLCGKILPMVTMQGHVYDAQTLLPISNATIAFDFENTAITDENGLYQKSLPIGVYDTVRCWSNYYETGLKLNYEIHEETNNLNFFLQRKTSSISGIVSDAQTLLPISNALVAFDSENTVATDENGSYQIALPYGIYDTVRCSADNYQSEVLAHYELVNDFHTVDFLLNPLTGVVSGMVTDAQTAQPITNAEITFTEELFTFSNAGGNYQMELPIGSYEHISFSAENYQSSTIDLLEIQSGTNILNVALSPMVSIDEISTNLRIYPNPTNDIIHFECSQTEQGTVTIQVFNMLGQLVTTVSEEVTANENRHFEVSLKAQPDGIYYYKVENGTKRVNGKIVKL